MQSHGLTLSSKANPPFVMVMISAWYVCIHSYRNTLQWYTTPGFLKTPPGVDSEHTSTEGQRWCRKTEEEGFLQRLVMLVLPTIMVVPSRPPARVCNGSH